MASVRGIHSSNHQSTRPIEKSTSDSLVSKMEGAFNKALDSLIGTYDWLHAKNPVTQKRQFWFVPFWYERFLGQSLYNTYIQDQGGETNNEKWQQLVDKVGQKLAKNAKREMNYEFVVVKSRQVNAWAMPGGKIAIYEGLLRQIETLKIPGYENISVEDKLAAVLSHEIVHADARHTAQRLEGLLIGNLFLMVLKSLIDSVKDFSYEIKINKNSSVKITRDTLLPLIHILTDLFMKLYFLAGSRSHEFEADRYGMFLMNESGYKPKAALWLQKCLDKQGVGLPFFLQRMFNVISSHPPCDKRYEANSRTLQEIQTQNKLSQK